MAAARRAGGGTAGWSGRGPAGCDRRGGGRHEWRERAPDRTTTTSPPPTVPPTTVPVADSAPAGRPASGVAARLPVDSCLVVEGPGLRFAHRGDTPLVPASTAKLLTATASLEALGPDAPIAAAADSPRSASWWSGCSATATTWPPSSCWRRSARVEVTPADGAAAILELIDDGSVDLQGVVVTDGSGHSRDNRVTCAALVDVLSRPGPVPLVRESLAVAGESGTLADRFVGTPLQGVAAGQDRLAVLRDGTRRCGGRRRPAPHLRARRQRAPAVPSCRRTSSAIQQQVGEAVWSTWSG